MHPEEDVVLKLLWDLARTPGAFAAGVIGHSPSADPSEVEFSEVFPLPFDRGALPPDLEGITLTLAGYLSGPVSDDTLIWKINGMRRETGLPPPPRPDAGRDHRS